MPMGEDEGLLRTGRRTSSGGLRRDIFALDLGQDEMSTMQNGKATTDGLLEIREGYTLIATGITYGPVLALGGYKDDSNTQSLLAVASGTNAADHLRLYSWDGSAAIFSFIDSLTGYTAGYESKIELIRYTDIVDGTLANTRAIMISTDQGGVATKVYDGSTVIDASWGAGDISRGVEANQGRVIAVGGASNSDALYHSDMYSATATGMTPVLLRHFRVGGGNPSSEIQTAKVFRGRDLVVFLDDSIEIILMSSSNYASPGAGLGVIAGGIPLLDWSQSVIHNRIGCGNYKTVVNVGEDMYFCDQDMQVRSLSQTITDARSGVRSFPVSEPIKDYLARINPIHRDKCVATQFERFYILSVPLDAAVVADTIFVLDVAQSARKQKPVWYGPWTNFDARAFGVMKLDTAATSSDRDPTLYFAQNATASGLVMRAFDGLTDNGTAIVFSADYPRESNKTVEHEKEPRYLNVFAQSSGTVTLEILGSKNALGFEHIGYLDTTGDSKPLPQDLPFDLGGEGLLKDQFNLEQFERVTDLQFRMVATASAAMKIVGYAYYAHIDSYPYQAEDS